jgi:LuxR family transcriptional regulator, quorum-sensing system regulator BjaR1
MVVELFKTVAPYAWSDVLERRELLKQDKRIVDEAAEFRMNGGLIVPIFTPEGYTGLVSVTAEAPELSEDVRAALSLACVFAHNKLLALKRRTESELVRLTCRERECLCWVSYGKSDWEIGEILSISEKTVNYHVENVKKKFGVATRLQAVAVAIRQGTFLPY